MEVIVNSLDVAHHRTKRVSKREKGMGSSVGRSTKNPTGYHCSVQEKGCDV